MAEPMTLADSLGVADSVALADSLAAAGLVATDEASLAPVAAGFAMVAAPNRMHFGLSTAHRPECLRTPSVTGRREVDCRRDASAPSDWGQDHSEPGGYAKFKDGRGRIMRRNTTNGCNHTGPTPPHGSPI